MLGLGVVLSALLLAVGQAHGGSVDLLELLEQVTPTSLDKVCDDLSKFFNVLNDAQPILAPFDGSTTDTGIAYPAGTISFTSTKNLENCQAYDFEGATIYRLNVGGSINISLPNFTFGGKESDAFVEASDVTVQVHYRGAGGSAEVEMGPIMTEVKSLGTVTMTRTGEEPEDVTVLAEDLLRPVLSYSLDTFLKGDFHFKVVPSDFDSSPSYSAFKTLFKAYMYNVHVNKYSP